MVHIPTTRRVHTDGDRRLAWLPFPEPSEAMRPPACGWHYGYSVITAGGAVSPCCAVPGEEDDFGNLVAGSVRFADVWNNDRVQSSRAAFAGQIAPGSPQAETVCMSCPLPTFMHHMYSLHDFKVLRQCDRVFTGSEPTLERAFRLLGRTWYGPPVDDLYRQEVSFQLLLQLFAMDANERDMKPFVQFCEDNLAKEFHATS